MREGNPVYCLDEMTERLFIPQTGLNYAQYEAVEAAGIKERLPEGGEVTRCLNRHDFRVACKRSFTGVFTGTCALKEECSLDGKTH